MSLENQLGFSGPGFANLGRSYGVLAPATRLGRTIFPPDRGSRARRDLEMVAMRSHARDEKPKREGMGNEGKG